MRARAAMPAPLRDGLNRLLPLVRPDEFVALARGWRGVKWQHQGRSRHGVDCVGLPIEVMREAGILPAEFQSPTDYGRLPKGDALVAELDRWCTRIWRRGDGVRPAPSPATLISIEWPQSTEGESHVAICAGPTLIHAYRQSSGVVEHSYRGRWERWTAGIWRLPGVRYE